MYQALCEICFTCIIYNSAVAVSSAPLPPIRRNWAAYLKKCYELSVIVKYYCLALLEG